ncbi:DoxX family protein [Acerihabitans sp. TG2]|uniref:DoxX family protein n=1 Tax=Acerihabitans sp. TG2 TaxID=3096008 RepID=UPI002B234EBC|nr:DoxX family protein [Acerihabitans sp. TG2]MEA9392028.1 DoxX family protein [Acerihabitans sp. TG2]
MLTAINNGFSRFVDGQDAGKLLLRLTFGILMLFHGYAKTQHGVSWIVDLLQSHGLPGFIAYGAFIGEIVAPIMIIVGFMTRFAGLVFAFNLLVATLLVGMGHFYTLTEVGAWALETEALYFFGGLIIMLVGPGKYAMMKN